ncbi:hypothetical protein [Gilliamella sp. WF3-4]|uniref:hypothetical protein n=1 Tax=Gilliamella sp. WF3-4 TaxID=3120255 RepID=UPI0011463056|nr:hypothetical protein [Gilliamella apicola]
MDKLTEYHGYLKRKIYRSLEDYKSNPSQKLSTEQIKICEKAQELEDKVMAWEKPKRKSRKCYGGMMLLKA